MAKPELSSDPWTLEQLVGPFPASRTSVAVFAGNKDAVDTHCIVYVTPCVQGFSVFACILLPYAVRVIANVRFSRKFRRGDGFMVFSLDFPFFRCWLCRDARRGDCPLRI